MSYFQNFPTIQYGNTVCLDITRRCTVLDNLSPYSYYPFTITENKRIDQVADGYYNDANHYWLVLMSNFYIDPYYDWPIDDTNFINLIYAKYGSLSEPQLRVKYYQNAWVDTSPITPAAFGALGVGLQKYFTPTFSPAAGPVGPILNYTRTQVDWTVSTNMIINYTVSNVVLSNTALFNTLIDGSLQSNVIVNNFITDERVQIWYQGQWVGNSQVSFANSTQVSVQHVFGNTTVGDTIIGVSSGTQANISNINISVVNIPPDEQALWSPVFYYDYETNLNEQKKFIRLLDAKYVSQVDLELKKDLNS